MPVVQLLLICKRMILSTLKLILGAKAAKLADKTSSALADLAESRDQALLTAGDTAYARSRVGARKARQAKKLLARRTEDIKDDGLDFLEDGAHAAKHLARRGAAYVRHVDLERVADRGVQTVKGHPFTTALVVLGGIALAAKIATDLEKQR